MTAADGESISHRPAKTIARKRTLPITGRNAQMGNDNTREAITIPMMVKRVSMETPGNE
jgi:hypothetical protein